MQSQHGADLDEARSKLRVLLDDFAAALPGARDALQGVDSRLAGLDGSIAQRHRESLQTFDEGSRRLGAALADVVDGKPGAIGSAIGLMRELKFRNTPPLLNSSLPFQQHVVPAPTMTRDQADAALSVSASVAVLTATQALAPPTPADLAATLDVQLTAKVVAKAAQLGNSAQAIYEFVRNQVAFQPYLGSRKGAANTLEQLRGNDTDQASLLIALLRAAGIPSRYVRGTVEMTPDSVKAWLGVDEAHAAASILTTAGLDGVAIVSGSTVVAIRSTHVWVEAWVPYANYRGVPNDNTGSAWIPLDPSFKTSTVIPGMDVLTPMGFNVDTFVATYISTFHAASPLEQLARDIQTYLDTHNPGKTVTDIERRLVLAPQLLGLLPATPPYAVLSITQRLSELEDAKRYKVRFHLYDGGVTFIDQTVNLLELAGRRLTIKYVGATAADQTTIDSFGGIYQTPPNLVRVKPVLRLDDVAVATSANSIGMGITHSSDMQFIPPAGASNVQPLVQNTIIAGNGQAIAFDTFLDVGDAFIGDDAFPPQDFLESILQATAVDYLSRVDRGIEKAGRLLGVVTTQDVSEAIVENSIAVSFSFGVPVTFQWTGLTVDADRRIIGPFDVDGDGSRNVPFMKLTGLDGSIMENRVFEDGFDQDAISTVKILELASDAGIGICKIQTSIATDCPGIIQPSQIISAINSALAQGHVVTIPKRAITVGLWSGTGYIDLDPTTGAGGYIISGGISGSVQATSGGSTVDSWPVTLPCDSTGVTGQVLDPPADSPAIGAVFCPDDSTITFTVRLTTTCKDGSTKVQDINLTTHKTKRQFGAANYTLNLQAFGTVTVIRKITILGVKAKTVSFAGGYTVYEDNGTPYSAPHWQDDNDDGDAAQPGERRFPVAYKRNAKMEVGADFTAVPSGFPGTLMIRGTDLPMKAATISGATATYPSTLQTSAVSTTIDLLNQKTIAWEFSPDNGASWCDARTTDHRVYVTLDDPQGGAKLWETVLDIGTRNAKGLTSPAAAVAAVWGDFQGPIPGVKKKPRDGHNVGDGISMNYWLNQSSATCQRLNAMLADKDGNGSCIAWAQLFRDVLLGLGIPGPQAWMLAVDPVKPNETNFMVKRWRFGSHIRSGPDGVCNSNTAGDDVAVAPKGAAVGPDLPCIAPGPDGILNSTPSGDDTIARGIRKKISVAAPFLINDPGAWVQCPNPLGDVVNLDGLPGQNNAEPPPTFANHWIVKYDGKFYDPSYGAGPFATANDHENAAIDGIQMTDGANPCAAREQTSSQELIYDVSDIASGQ